MMEDKRAYVNVKHLIRSHGLWNTPVKLVAHGFHLP